MTVTDARLSLRDLAPDSYRQLLQLAGTAERAALESGLELPLLELVRIRTSQLNGCAFCLDLHTRDARRAGETEQRLYGLSAWRDSPLFGARERAALSLAESITLLPRAGLPDQVYREAVEEFGEAQLALLIWVTTVVNAFNRLSVSQRLAPTG
ncbi:carboxymuconolactone decarboxylase family protein [Kitasatospora sp. NPDC058965]|uniref:carboxymuconolactone decarboxylase family protein n=1 Tax=Kitasatospora sp. NPDC058965 TaxID=3346682 RepID=UPI0036CA471A